MLIGTARAPWRAASARMPPHGARMLSRSAENGVPASATGGVLSSMSNAPISGVISGVSASRTSCSEIAQARPSASTRNSSSSAPSVRGPRRSRAACKHHVERAQLLVEPLLEAIVVRFGEVFCPNVCAHAMRLSKERTKADARARRTQGRTGSLLHRRDLPRQARRQLSRQSAVDSNASELDVDLPRASAE